MRPDYAKNCGGSDWAHVDGNGYQRCRAIVCYACDRIFGTRSPLERVKLADAPGRPDADAGPNLPAVGAVPKRSPTRGAYSGVAKPNSGTDDVGAARAGALDRPDQPHYAKLSPEPIDVIEGWGLNYRIGNAVKYLARAGRKASTSAASDYRKALSYIRRELNAIEGKQSWS